MPEGPELHISSRLINERCKNFIFGGKVIKSEVSTKNPDIQFCCSKKGYKISAKARGKEIKVFLKDVEKATENQTEILFRFGMSGCFKISAMEAIPKHAHLQFFTKDKKMVLSFVDPRRFGKWLQDEDWGKDRGPDPIYEYEEFRENILENLDEPAFSKPICEVLLNQKYFNGIGNYLRMTGLDIHTIGDRQEILSPNVRNSMQLTKQAEILYRADVRPFDEAKEVLKKCRNQKSKCDLIRLCQVIPNEVLNLDGGTWYDDSSTSNDFQNWLQCYSQEGMNNLVDSNGRTIWFAGKIPGKLAPKNGKKRVSKKMKSQIETEATTDENTSSKKIKN